MLVRKKKRWSNLQSNTIFLLFFHKYLGFLFCPLGQIRQIQQVFWDLKKKKKFLPVNVTAMGKFQPKYLRPSSINRPLFQPQITEQVPSI